MSHSKVSARFGRRKMKIFAGAFGRALIILCCFWIAFFDDYCGVKSTFHAAVLV